ncbi:hypothetical protein [Angustibacter sp. Root456]|uniref:hypothetical protein n=1 Tax=Angustibacter sp. Root456 TaxID=1736539 RepID=UPI0006F8F639|nr:hypothetical protein [Angustibacter sp. Root456]KQX62911.1 hypothetical protein ASD06_12920 [Angustibacter sp. Root456]
MDALDVAKVCLRRWYVVLPVILLAVGAGLSMTSSRPSSYSGTAAFALIYTHADELKPNQPDPRTKNPLLAGGGYGLLTETLVADLSSPTTQRELAAPGLTPLQPSTPDGPTLATGRFYSVAAPQNSASIIVSASGPTPQAVEQTLKNVLAAAPQRAEQIQSRLGAPRLAQLTTTVTAQPEILQLPPPSPLKLLIAITGVGCLAAAGLALVVERLATRRRRRRQLEAMLDGDDERPHSHGSSHKAEPVR